MAALHTYDPRRGTVTGWFLKVTCRVPIDRWRRKASRPEVMTGDAYLDAVADPNERWFERAALEERDAADSAMCGRTTAARPAGRGR